MVWETWQNPSGCWPGHRTPQSEFDWASAGYTRARRIHWDLISQSRGGFFFFFMWRQTGNHNINSGTCRQNLIPFEFYIWISAWLLKFLCWLSHEECSCLWWCHETWLHLLCWSDEYFKGCFCSFTVAGSLTLFPLDTPYIHMPLLLPRQQMLCHTNQLD